MQALIFFTPPDICLKLFPLHFQQILPVLILVAITCHSEIGNENYGSWEEGYQIDTSRNQDGQPEIQNGALYGEHFIVFTDSMHSAAAEIGLASRWNLVWNYNGGGTHGHLATNRDHNVEGNRAWGPRGQVLLV